MPILCAALRHSRNSGKKTTPVGVINHGDDREKRCPSLYETTGNEIYRHGQQKLPARALKFKATGDVNFTQIPLFFAKGEHIEFFFCMRIIYIRMQKKKIHI